MQDTIRGTMVEVIMEAMVMEDTVMVVVDMWTTLITIKLILSFNKNKS